MDTFGRIVLSVIESSPSFKVESVSLYVGALESVLYTEVSFIQSVPYQTIHSTVRYLQIFVLNFHKKY